jgi:methylmalonyl-CoA/ethylmalonyl-CoA epimerase
LTVLKGVDHIAIAVGDLDASIKQFKEQFGVPVKHREIVESNGVEIALIEVGGTAIELVQGITENSPIKRYVEKKGPGIHHIAFEVEDILDTLSKLEAAGIKMIDQTPRPGKQGSQVAFIHPESTQKILYELVQKKSSE